VRESFPSHGSGLFWGAKGKRAGPFHMLDYRFGLWDLQGFLLRRGPAFAGFSAVSGGCGLLVVGAASGAVQSLSSR
jgi:hypothetical protein